MVQRVICDPVVPLLVVIIAILGNGHSSAHAQAKSSVGQTPYLIFSTYLGGCGVEGDDNYTDDNSNGNNIAVDAQNHWQ